MRYFKESMNETLIDITLHLFSSLVFAVIIYFKTQVLIYPAVIIMGGALLDLDHLLDYFLFYKSKFHLGKFLNSIYLKSGKVYLILHSWEICFIIIVVAIAINSFWLSLLSLSMSMHLAIDNIQRRKPLFYFFVYRVLKRFNAYELLPEEIEKIALREQMF